MDESSDVSYRMHIKPEHQGDAKLFDPLQYPPTSHWWPHMPMIESLKGEAGQIVAWARQNGFLVTISYDSSFDPVRKINAHWYSLVVSLEKTAEHAA
ncbi:MAG TPA: hypothetical protein VN665_01890 [Candidatus Paceibacterota bacterium]|nr:hypothetical protein [Candidatus Paceibacterota bacterium]